MAQTAIIKSQSTTVSITTGFLAPFFHKRNNTTLPLSSSSLPLPSTSSIVTAHVEGLLGDVVVLALDNRLEALDRIGYLYIFSGRPGKLLGHVEWLREEIAEFCEPALP